MTEKNKSTMERAIGIIEGVSFCVPQNVQDALAVAGEMLDEILRKEQNDEGTERT